MWYFVYMMTNHGNTVIYTGVTNNLVRRIYEHKNKLIKEFSSKYKLYKLIYYEVYENTYEAIRKEKKIKAGSRKKKISLIESINPDWKDLYEYVT
ncbi:MAG: GIY-YIG nuclease family protein [candidate division Zixibacteria bacterium]|nr:GIY-YIG nuclease family protein [candidate division Zixibacteria bacterium]